MTLAFLSGLPRSGSTLLGALLCQRPDLQVTATSGLIDVLGAAAAAWETSPQCKSGDMPIDGLYPVLRAIVDTHHKDAGVVLDKSRGWPDAKIVATMTRVLGYRPKIVATVRPVQECLASFMRITKFEGNPLEFAFRSSLAQHLFSSHDTLKSGFEANPDCFHFVEYADLVADPQRECDRIAGFLGLPSFVHTLTGLSNPVPENDARTWGIPNLHFVRPTVKKAIYDARAILSDNLWDFLDGNEFWPSNKRVAGNVVLLEDCA